MRTATYNIVLCVPLNPNNYITVFMVCQTNLMCFLCEKSFPQSFFLCVQNCGKLCGLCGKLVFLCLFSPFLALLCKKPVENFCGRDVLCDVFLFILFITFIKLLIFDKKSVIMVQENASSGHQNRREEGSHDRN